MRFAKTDVPECFDKQDRSYRLAFLCTRWILDGARYKPSASEEARGIWMGVRGTWVPFADLADKLKSSSRHALSSDFILNQLHALIRAPFEILRDYCENYDKSDPTPHLFQKMKEAPWYEYARMVRNAISHNFHFQYSKHDKKILPVTWNGITLTQEMEGQAMTYEALWHKRGYELFLEMRIFAEALPEAPQTERA